MKLTTNLATRRYVNMRQVNAALLLLSLFLGALLVLRVREIAYNSAEKHRVSALDRGGQGGAPQVSEAQLKAQGGEVAFANQLIEKKSIKWLSLLDRLEQVVPEGVALTGIAPEDKTRLLKISGVARSFANLRTLLENMEQSANFSEVYLLGQKDAKVGQTQQGIGFSITCRVSYR